MAREEGEGRGQIAELLRANERIREEIAELRSRHASALKHLVNARAGSEAERQSRRAALNLMEDAIAARRDAEEANRAKDEFLAVLSHELRTPLAAILIWSDALRAGILPADQVARAIEAIAQCAESQSRLVEDLLDLSRLTFGKLALTIAGFDVSAAIAAAAEMVRPTMAEKGIVFEADFSVSLGLLAADERRIKQILANLLTNAARFTRGGGTVVLRARKVGGHLELQVADTGEGFTADFKSRLFERFRQADMGETRTHGGLGIGLAITKQLVELHGGTIEGHSDGPGRGASFRVRLPWLDAEPPAHPAARRSLAARASLSGARVLLVEDDELARDAMQWTLENAGASVVSVPTATQAIEALTATSAIDVIVSDLGLPDLSGVTLMEHIVADYRARGCRRPASCAVSAHVRDVDRRRAIDAGFDMYLAKPIAVDRLVEAVTDLFTLDLTVDDAASSSRGELPEP